jgi:hypothetical protein
LQSAWGADRPRAFLFAAVRPSYFWPCQVFVDHRRGKDLDFLKFLGAMADSRD